jgi:hypothetical protein
LLFSIERGYHDTHEKIKHKEVAQDDKAHKEDRPIDVVILDGLLIDANRIDT